MESNEAREFRSILRGFIAEHFPEDERRSWYAGTSLADDHQLWGRIAPLGVLDAVNDGSATVDWLASIAFEAGYGLLPVGLVQTCLGHFALRCATQPAALPTILPTQRVAVALDASTELTVAPDGAASLRVSGATDLVPFLKGSAWLFLPVPLEGQLRWAAIDTSLGPISETSSIDRTVTLGRITFQQTPAHLLPVECGELITCAAMSCGAAEAAGVCERAVEMTCQYVKDRKQFDLPIGGFQAVQHKLADMHLETEALKSLAFFAGWALHASPEQREMTARAASRYREMTACAVVERAIQAHGGIGFTWEHTLHHFLRRVRLIQALTPGGERAAPALIDAARADGGACSVLQTS
jgi:hypothetical protein